jgi:hypothetical protein
MMRSTRSDLNFVHVRMLKSVEMSNVIRYIVTLGWYYMRGGGGYFIICVSPHLDETTYFLLEPKWKLFVYAVVQQHCLALVKNFR